MITEWLSCEIHEDKINYPDSDDMQCVPAMTSACKQFISVLMSRMQNSVISTCIYTAYEQVFIGMIAPNPHLCHYFLQNIIFDLMPFWFTPTFSWTQLGHETRATYIKLVVFICILIMFSQPHASWCISLYVEWLWICDFKRKWAQSVWNGEKAWSVGTALQTKTQTSWDIWCHNWQSPYQLYQ